MATISLPIYKSKLRGALYVLNFILSFQVSLVSYFYANYLSHLGLEDKHISFVFALSSALAMLGFFFAPKLFNLLGAYRSAFVASLAYLLSFIFLSFLNDIVLSVMVFVLLAVPYSILVASLDSLMERFTDEDASTGRQRGMFITMASAAFVAGPFIGGQILKNGDFEALFLSGAALIVPFLLILFWRLKRIERIRYNEFKIVNIAKKLKENKDIRNIFFAQLVLYFFYSVMVIYTAVYLKEYLHYSYEFIGLALSVALLPFVFITVPLGHIADKYIGEKEMLTVGFIIMGIATFVFAKTASLGALWVLFSLFFTRVGAATVQAMTESYFFKQIDGKDADLISAFRALYPLTSILAPLFAAIVLAISDLSLLFFVLSFVCIFAIVFSLRIKDSK